MHLIFKKQTVAVIKKILTPRNSLYWNTETDENWRNIDIKDLNWSHVHWQIVK